MAICVLPHLNSFPLPLAQMMQLIPLASAVQAVIFPCPALTGQPSLMGLPTPVPELPRPYLSRDAALCLLGLLRDLYDVSEPLVCRTILHTIGP